MTARSIRRAAERKANKLARKAANRHTSPLMLTFGDESENAGNLRAK